MSILNINGMAMPDPSALTLGYSDLDGDSTTRNEQEFCSVTGFAAVSEN